MTYKDIQALTHLTPDESKPYVKLTNNQWSVYFYLLSMSNYNAIASEDHRYIYRKDISATKIAKTFKFSTRTYYNILDTLEKHFLIDNSNKEYILLPLPRLYTSIPQKLLKQLLNCYDFIGIELLRTYLFCNDIKERFGIKPFTIRNIIRCLGQSDTRPENYKKILACIDLLSYWDLISINSKIITDKQIGKYRTYVVLKVNTESSKLDELDINDGEMLTIDGLNETELKILERDLEWPTENKE